MDMDREWVVCGGLEEWNSMFRREKALCGFGCWHADVGFDNDSS